MKLYTLLIVLAIAFLGCKKKDDSTKPKEEEKVRLKIEVSNFQFGPGDSFFVEEPNDGKVTISYKGNVDPMLEGYYGTIQDYPLGANITIKAARSDGTKYINLRVKDSNGGMLFNETNKKEISFSTTAR